VIRNPFAPPCFCEGSTVPLRSVTVGSPSMMISVREIWIVTESVMSSVDVVHGSSRSSDCVMFAVSWATFMIMNTRMMVMMSIIG